MIRILFLIMALVFTSFAQEKSPSDMEFKVRTAKAKSRLKQIAVTYAMYFTDGVTVKIPTPDVVDVDESIKTYIHPATGKSNKFLFIKPGYEYKGSSSLLLAVTDKPIDGKYLACFEDGHVSFITKEQFQQHAFIFGLKKIKTEFKKLEKKEQNEIHSLIAQLGAKKYKERKEAKTKIIAKGYRILGFMETNKNHPDFETKVSIQEIIKELEKLAPQKLSKRPAIN